MLIGSLVINVLLEVVKYLPPTFRVTHSEFNFEHNGTLRPPDVTDNAG
jgi:hypothetical protein